MIVLWAFYLTLLAILELTRLSGELSTEWSFDFSIQGTVLKHGTDRAVPEFALSMYWQGPEERLQEWLSNAEKLRYLVCSGSRYRLGPAAIQEGYQ